MLKKCTLAVSFIFSIFMAACSDDFASGSLAGGTIDPNSIAETSSSSEGGKDADVNPIVTSSSAGEKNVGGSSSSEAIEDSVAKSSSSEKSVSLSSSSSSWVGPKNVSSSSSYDDKGFVPDPLPESSSSAVDEDRSSSSEYHNLLVHAENFSLQCRDDASDSDTPSANYYVYEDAEVVRFENIKFALPCDAEQRADFLNSVNEAGANVGLDGNVIYVNFIRSKGLDYACSCVADAGFKLPQYYPGIEYAVFDQQKPLQMKEILNKDIN